MTDPNHRRGSRRKDWSIVVVAVPSERYPEFGGDPAHLFASMPPARRNSEIDEVCSRLWMRCNEADSATPSEPLEAACAA
jgi:hypothetical protein